MSWYLNPEENKQTQSTQYEESIQHTHTHTNTNVNNTHTQINT